MRVVRYVPVSATMYQYLLDSGMTREEYEWFGRNQVKANCAMGNDYYLTNETCLKLFFTTGVFAPGAQNFAKAFDIVAIGGTALVQFLLYHEIGIAGGAEPRVDPEMIAAWAGAE